MKFGCWWQSAVRCHEGASHEENEVCCCVAGLPGIAVAGRGLLLAQGELSLEGLAARMQTLADRVDAIEALWVNSEPLVMADGSCVIGYEGGPHDATVLKFKSAFDEWPNTDNIRGFAVAVDPETGRVALQYETLYDNQFVIEMWQDCEFLGTTAWWPGRY